jgi:hypothetical protein
MEKPGTKMGQRIQYRSQSREQCTNGGDLAIRALHDKISAEVFIIVRSLTREKYALGACLVDLHLETFAYVSGQLVYPDTSLGRHPRIHPRMRGVHPAL